MAENKVYLTPEGLAKLEAELQNLHTVRRQEVATKIQRAKELGGTDNNAEYEEAKNDQAFVEGRILALERMIQRVALIQSGRKKLDKVFLGCTVTVRNQEGLMEQYTIVGKEEADPANGKISNESPVGKALIGKKRGEHVQIPVPAGKLKLEILEVT